MGVLTDSWDVSFSNGRLMITATEDGGLVNLAAPGAADYGLSALMGGVTTLAPGGGGMTAAGHSAFSAGTDAIVEINGVLVTRANNIIDVDGVSIQVTQVSAGAERIDDNGVITWQFNPLNETVISTVQDTETIFNAIKSFVEEYNAMVDLINGFTRADPTFRSYAPLTAEQRREMSDREIELWEEQARGGLLRNDINVTPFLNNMHAILYSRPASSPFALFNIGIEAVDFRQPGRLTLDETRLREVLEQDIDGVAALFTDSTNGIARQMTNVMDGFARVSAANPGTLVTLAGVPNHSTDRVNSISNTITEINERLRDLQARYDRERARYWRQFTAMERIMAAHEAQMEQLYSFMMQNYGM
jgi:flagellar capping protein FliD